MLNEKILIADDDPDILDVSADERIAKRQRGSVMHLLHHDADDPGQVRADEGRGEEVRMLHDVVEKPEVHRVVQDPIAEEVADWGGQQA